MNENLKKALEIARQMYKEMKGYEGLVSLSTNGWTCSIHLHREEFLANFPDYQFRDATSHVKLFTFIDEIEILCVVTHGQHFNLQQKGTLE